jgi:hypothetical protein
LSSHAHFAWWIIYWLVVWNIFFVLYIWNNHPIWLIFFKGVVTTNQYKMYCILYVRYHQDIPIPNASCIEHVRRGLHNWYIYITPDV